MAAKRIASTSLTRYYIRCFQLFGHWIDYQHSSLAYRIFSVCVRIWYLVYLSCLISYLGFADELEEITNSLYISLTILSLFAKLVNLRAFNDPIRDNLDKVHNFELLNEDEWTLYRKRHKKFTRLMLFYYSVCYVTLAMTILSAIVRTEPTLPFRGLYPLDWRGDRLYYWIVFTYQSLGMILCLHLNVAMETFACFMLFEVSIQFEMLGRRIKRYGWNTKDDSAREQLAEMRIWIQRHYRVIELAKNVQDNFSLANFSQIATSGIVLCALLFQLALISPREYTSYASYALFTMSMATQIFLPCYFGNELMLRSDQLQLAGYSSNWPMMTHKYKVMLSIVIERTKKDMKVVVAKLFPLNLETFTSILNMSYRLFTLLQNFVA